MSDLPPDLHDEALRAALRAEADGVTARPELLERIRSEGSSRPAVGRPRTPWLLVAAAAVAVIALAATLAASDGGDADQRLDLVDDPSSPVDLPDLPVVACAPGEDFDLAVHLVPDASTAEVSTVGEALEATGFAMRYVDRDETFARFQELFADSEGLLATVDPDDLPTSYVLDLDQPADEAAVRAAVEGSSTVYQVVTVECERPTTDMFDLLGRAFPCSEGYQTVFYLSPTASAVESDAVRDALETHDRVRAFRVISTDEVAAALEAEAPEASWDPASIPTAYLATSDTEEDDLAIRGEVSDLAGITGTSSSDCTDAPPEPTGERPTQAVAVTDRGHVVVLDTATGDVIRDLGGFDDPTDPAVADQPGGPYSITGVALHPNGQDIYFETCCEPASGTIFRVPIDGSVSIDTSRLVPVAYGFGIDISADGRWLAYASPAGVGLHDLETGSDVTVEFGLGNLVQVAVNHDGSEVAAERALEYSPPDAPSLIVRSELTTFHRDGETLVRGETTGGDVRLLPIYADAGRQLTTVAARDGVIDLNVDVSGTWFLATPSEMPLRGYSEAADAREISGSFTAADW